jgi:hypothetical protein
VSLLLLLRSQGSGGPAPALTLDNRGVSGNATRDRTVTGSNQAGSALATGLLGWYKLDGDLTDSSGNARHWTHGTADGYTTGKFGQALLTDATGGAGSVLYRESAFVAAGPLSVAVWAYFEAIQSGQGAAYLWTQAQDSSFFEQAVFAIKDIGDGTGVIQGQMASGFGQALSYLPGTAITGQWWHIAMTFDGVGQAPGTLKLYVNGVLRSSATRTPNYVVNDITVNRSTLGGAWFAAPTNPADACRIDNLMVWNRTLGASEIAAAALQSPFQGPANRGVVGVASKASSVVGRPPN